MELEKAIENAESSYRLSKDEKSANAKVFKDFRYYYDEEIGWGVTRYESGLWLITLGFFFLRRYL